MQMQIWKIYVSEGALGAIHGFAAPIYEAYVPDLKLTVNYATSFVNEDSSRYESRAPEEQMVQTPDPELVCEIELSRSQIDDLKALAGEDNPEIRIQKLIAQTLKEKGLNASAYEDDDEE